MPERDNAAPPAGSPARSFVSRVARRAQAARTPAVLVERARAAAHSAAHRGPGGDAASDWRASVPPAVRARLERVLQMYTLLRDRGGVPAVPGEADPGAVPPPRQVRLVEQEMLKHLALDTFFDTWALDGDLDLAAIRATRALLEINAGPPANMIAHTMARGGIDEVRLTSDVCRGMIALSHGTADLAMQMFGRHPLPDVLRLAGREWFRAAFADDPPTARHTLARMRHGELAMTLDAVGWRELAQHAFAAGDPDAAQWALGRLGRVLTTRLPDGAAAAAQFAEALATANLARAASATALARGLEDPRLLRTLREARWLARWMVRVAAARQFREAPPPELLTAGAIWLGVLDPVAADLRNSSTDLGDHVQTLAVLAGVARRHWDVSDQPRPALAEFVGSLRSRHGSDAAAGPARRVHLTAVTREADGSDPLPDQTWFIAAGEFGDRSSDEPTAPFADPRVQPIFVSFTLPVASLSQGWVDYLRAHGPIGCRDWSTVHLLLAAGVDAFFTGDLAATLGNLARPGTAAPTAVFVDAPREGPGSVTSWRSDDRPDRPLARNLQDALSAVDQLAGARRVVTSDVHAMLAARSAGTPVEFGPDNPADPRLFGLSDLDAAQFADLRRGAEARLDAALDAIGAGGSAQDVYARWREVCAADVAAARARHVVTELPAGSIDVRRACAEVLGRVVTVERSEPGPDGPEINVEFSLDGNLKHQLGVVLHSIVTRASRPIRAFVLCRDHGPADFERRAREFPTVSFVWLPTDTVDYGDITGMLRHITIATMDRLLLPELLPNVDRMIHHDLDAVCLADLAELYDVDLQGTPLAARDSRHPRRGSGFFANTFFTLTRLRGEPKLAREFLMQAYTRHRWDFGTLNAGVLVLDLAAMRRDRFCQRFLPFAERYGANDQGVLIMYSGGNHVELGPEWNFWPGRDIVVDGDQPKIVHWLGGRKPWKPRYVIGKELWRDAEAGYAERVRERG